MSNLPSFTASLLHKHAYGLDISGEVVDGGQLNTKDLRYQNTPPNPQQYTQQPEGQTLEPGASLYHGTTMNLWKTQTPAKLSLTTDHKAAEIEAQNAVESASYHDGHPERPIVVMIKFGDLSGYELQPEQGESEVHEGGSWQESLKDAGSFSISGDLEALKPKFKLVN